MEYSGLATWAWEYISDKGEMMKDVKVNDWVQRTLTPAPGQEPFD
jgi:hypothetical protein